MYENWRDLFSFNHRERNGIVVLFLLIVSIMAVQWSLPYFYPNRVSFDYKVVEEQLAQLDKPLNAYVGDFSDKNTNLIVEEEEGYSEIQNPEFFNPNDGIAQDWEWTGLSKAQVASILRYLDKGGRFRTKSDVSKMYVVSEEMYQRIEPYLLLPDTIVQPDKKSNSAAQVIDTVSDKPKLVSINVADTTELKSLRGVGSYYAKQIVEYRDRLGGFCKIDQLYEIERMREETVQMIEPFIIFDTTIIRKLHINSDRASVLVRHPYITWNMAKNIQDHREFSHRFKSVDELVELGLLTDELYSKLAPYLEL